jgi:hypothetical protein
MAPASEDERERIRGVLAEQGLLEGSAVER